MIRLDKTIEAPLPEPISVNDFFISKGPSRYDITTPVCRYAVCLRLTCSVPIKKGPGSFCPVYPSSGEFGLNDTLCKHCIRNLDKTGDVSATDVADRSVSTFTVFDTCIVNVLHNFVQMPIHFFA